MASNVDPWTLSPDAFPGSGPEAEQLRFLVGYAILAPSSHNSQPWLFRVGEGCIDVHADRTRALPVVDPYDRTLTISCGAAVGTLEVAMRAFRSEPVVAPLPSASDPDLLARVSRGAPHRPDERDRRLLEAITQRRTTRSSYADAPVPDDVLARCRAWCDAFGCGFASIADRQAREGVAALVAEGDRTQFADARFRRELAAWIHSRRLGSRDGMSGSNFGLPDVLSPVGALVVRTFDLGNGIAASDRDKIGSGSPVLAVIATPGDAAGDWLAAGRALSHLLLELTAAGFTASYLNQPIEVAELRPRLRDAVAVDGHPQLLIRIGRAPGEPPASVRRPVEDVLLT